MLSGDLATPSEGPPHAAAVSEPRRWEDQARWLPTGPRDAHGRLPNRSPPSVAIPPEQSWPGLAWPSLGIQLGIQLDIQRWAPSHALHPSLPLQTCPDPASLVHVFRLPRGRQHQNTLAPTDPAVAAPSSPNPSGVTLQPEDAACPSWGPSSCESRLFPARPHHARTIFALDCGSTPALLGQASTTPAALHSTHSSPLHPPPKLLRPATIIHNPACFEASLTRRTPRALLE
ncbi:hypothetical protein PTTG_25689 [Puccinia triticina 1-1 BBBD Race 1]|uniref:Uncharacterized protein n=1 Tax=Puccinia triticina (isolate 1-1 / race 1 (BBBD)) TaxID=630390 RepID=A0A180H110_PUCT1|nr:hypothetical protein PTTG_25689 [Puccinia triticina 1-1 BBBD Race 1]